MIHTGIWLVISAIVVYMATMITSTLFTIPAMDKEVAAFFTFIVAPFIVIALFVINAIWPL
jgi:hypothetical protein